MVWQNHSYQSTSILRFHTIRINNINSLLQYKDDGKHHNFLYAPTTKKGGHIDLPLSVRSSRKCCVVHTSKTVCATDLKLYGCIIEFIQGVSLCTWVFSSSWKLYLWSYGYDFLKKTSCLLIWYNKLKIIWSEGRVMSEKSRFSQVCTKTEFSFCHIKKS